MRFGIVTVLLAAQAIAVACVRLPAGEAPRVVLRLRDRAAVSRSPPKHEHDKERSKQDILPRKFPVVCDRGLPQLADDILLAHHADFRTRVARELQMHAAYLQNMPSESCTVMKDMLLRGVSWNAMGMDFSALFANESGEESTIATIEVIAKNVFPWYFTGCHGCEDVMRMDHANRWRPRSPYFQGLGRFPLSDADRFRRDGFFRFADLGVDAAALQKQVGEKLAFTFKGANAKGVQLDGMEPVINSETIRGLASYYMGTPATLTGYKILRLTSKASRKNYVSGYWHHDNCGMRLKLLILLQDVDDDEGMPTEIAVGSQNTLFFHGGPSGVSRYDDDYVLGKYRTTKMTGKAGSGFIFDTNTVHKGNVDGAHLSRDVVIVEYAAADKLEKGVPPEGPCPEPDSYTIMK